jgi:hypothetical protein
MHGSSLTMNASANLRGAKICTTRTKTCTASPLQEAITDLLYHFNPKKTWAFVADTFGLKERAAKHRLSNNSSYTIEELQVLFQSDDGEAYFDAMMGDAAPAWYVWHKQIRAQAAKRRLAAEATQEALQLEAQLPPTAQARRFTKGNANDTAKLSAAFARKETALGFLAPEHNRAVVRAVAPAEGKTVTRIAAGRKR